MSTVSAIKKQAAECYAALFRWRYPEAAAACDGRVEKAVEICATIGGCRESDIPDVYEVRSQSKPNAWYVVDLRRRSCSCPDSQAGHLCKHRLAIAFKLHGPDWTVERDRLMYSPGLCSPGFTR